MAQVRKINFGEFEPSGDVKADMAKLAGLLQEALDDVYSKLPSGATGTVTTAKIAAGSVKVEDGVVVTID